ncbi:unnamed protein product [Chironomus riparius]|uniref:Uncharacterized protein n=1 Tax=Chironomus riparius TaxID=315576 RepID=A0A9N9WQ57_9DIPT|nr:unnamed protein product [Chironomus riparius]
MKLHLILIILSASTCVKCSSVDVDLASVINKVQTIDDNESVLQIIQNLAPSGLARVIPYFNRDCVTQKLGLTNFVQSKVYEIKDLNLFYNLNAKNKKIITAVELAGRLCTKDSKTFDDKLIIDSIESRYLLLGMEMIFPNAKLDTQRTIECFKWAISKVKPNSPLLEGFKLSSMKYSIEQCKESTSITDYSNIMDKNRQILDIHSCDSEEYGQHESTAISTMEFFVLGELPFIKMNEMQGILRQSFIKDESKVLERQLVCILRDLSEY